MFDYEELLDALCVLATEEKLMVSVRESIKGGAIAAGTTILGGLLLGPVGLALGGAVGGLTAAATCKDFVSVAEVIKTAKHRNRRTMAEHFDRFLRSISIYDVAKLTLMIASNPRIRDIILAELKDFLVNKMSLKMKC